MLAEITSSPRVNTRGQFHLAVLDNPPSMHDECFGKALLQGGDCAGWEPVPANIEIIQIKML
jgi:hypothetical protein